VQVEHYESRQCTLPPAASLPALLGLPAPNRATLTSPSHVQCQSSSVVMADQEPHWSTATFELHRLESGPAVEATTHAPVNFGLWGLQNGKSRQMSVTGWPRGQR
jgi:hypothetical protein